MSVRVDRRPYSHTPEPPPAQAGRSDSGGSRPLPTAPPPTPASPGSDLPDSTAPSEAAWSQSEGDGDELIRTALRERGFPLTSMEWVTIRRAGIQDPENSLSAMYSAIARLALQKGNVEIFGLAIANVSEGDRDQFRAFLAQCMAMLP